jgi:acetyl-CoA C-acetyltransferase
VPLPSSQPDPRAPVLVGVGTASASAPVTELMTRAALAAADDAGAPGLLRMVQRVAVPQGSWSLANPARSVATRIGAPGARTWLYEIGVSQQELINEALSSIASGQADVVLVVGGEARAFERQGGLEPDEDSGPPDVTERRPPDFVAPIEMAAGIVWPVVQQYALIENALAAHEQLTPAQQRQDIGRLWARYNEVARHNPLAAFPEPRAAADIATPGPRNRPLAYPYNLWHSSQWTVDQAAALLFCAADVARSHGVPTDRWVFPHVALHSSQAVTLTARPALHDWPAMAEMGRAAEAHLHAPVGALGIAEVYSCFPAAVRVQQRALGLDLEGTPTCTGGMAFAGGPFNNYVLQSMAAVVAQLRAQPSAQALVTTVSGMLSKPGLAVWSCTPRADPLIADMASAGGAADVRPVAPPEAPPSTGTVVSFTVTYAADDPLAPARTAIVADRGDGERAAATCEDADIARQCLAEGLIGHVVHLDGTTFVP